MSLGLAGKDRGASHRVQLLRRGALGRGALRTECKSQRTDCISLLASRYLSVCNSFFGFAKLLYARAHSREGLSCRQCVTVNALIVTRCDNQHTDREKCVTVNALIVTV